MKRAYFLLVTLGMVIGSYGCASKDYVRQQVDPLADRISRLEAATQSLKDCCGKAEAAAARAESVAKDAQAAAKDARFSAEKATKSFELHQKK